MKNKLSARLFTAKLLSISAMVVLLGFLVWWLMQTFNDEQRRHRRDLELVFRETYMQSQFSRFWTDSTYRRRLNVFSRGNRNNGGGFPGERMRDSTNATRPRQDTIINISMTSSGNPPMRMRWNESDEYIDSMMGNGIQVSMPIATWDTINLDTLRKSLHVALESADLPTTFDLQRIKMPKRPQDDTLAAHAVKSDSSFATMESVMKRGVEIKSVSVSAGNVSIVADKDTVNIDRPAAFFRQMNNDRLVASFPVPYPLLLAKMKWQLLFSTLMLTLMGMALYYNYRNMLAQVKLVKSKDNLISNITHELKTPIATVGVALEAIQNFNALQNPEKTKEYLSISQQELRRLNLLVDKVLHLSMFDADKMRVDTIEIDLLRTAKQVADSLQLQMERAGGHLIWHAPENQYRVKADEQHLTSILFNLLDNAIKYRADRPLQLDISMQHEGENIQCIIADNGIGIPSADRNKVFEKFYRVQNGDTHNVKGYGLGLSYVHEAITAMKGSIRVQETPGGGAAFIITLPAA